MSRAPVVAALLLAVALLGACPLAKAKENGDEWEFRFPISHEAADKAAEKGLRYNARGELVIVDKKILPFGYAADSDPASRTGALHVPGYYGRLDIYTAEFGTSACVPPEEQRLLPVVLAKPINACGTIENAEELSGALAVAARGNCTFHSKAQLLEAAGALSVLIVNDRPGNLHMPGVGVDNVTIPAAMIMQTRGHQLAAAARSRAAVQAPPLQARFVLRGCKHEAAGGDAVLTADGQGSIAGLPLSASLADSMVISLLSADGRLQATIDSTVAAFSAPPQSMGLLPIVWASGAGGHACSAEQLQAQETAVAGALLIARRGICPFSRKAIAASRAGAAALLILNSDDERFLLISGGADVSDVSIPVALASAAEESVLKGMSVMYADFSPGDWGKRDYWRVLQLASN